MADSRLTPRLYLLAGTFLLAGLFATLFAGYSVKTGLERQAHRQFAVACDEIRLKIEALLQTHRQVLLGGAALFDASDSVSRREWRSFAQRLEIDQHFNGIQGLGFSLLIPKERLAKHIAEIRAQGFPDYTVRPAGERAVYTSIIYLEPFEGRNLRAFGFDMFSEPVRRQAMEQARDGNIVALTGKVVLVQETYEDVQAGTLMYAPVYRKGMPTDTTEQRRAALLGWVYSPFRMGDLLRSVLSYWNSQQYGSLLLRAYDGTETRPENLLFDSQPAPENNAASSSRPTLRLRTDFNGRGWTLAFSRDEAGPAGVDYSKAWITLAGGATASVLLFLLGLSYLNTRRKALAIANELTAEMRARAATEAVLNARLNLKNAALNASANAIAITDINAVNQWVNPAYLRLTGYTLEECMGKAPKDLVKSGLQGREFYGSLWQTIISGKPWHGELINRRKDGTLYYEEMTITPVPNAQSQTTHFVAVKQDITERVEIEKKLRELNQDFIAFLENTTDFIYFKDENNRIRFCSQALARLKGHAHWHDMVGECHFDNFDEDGASMENKDAPPTPGDGQPKLNKVGRYRDETGCEHWVSTKQWPLYDSEGKNVVGEFGISRDISNLVAMEQQLKLREALFRAIFEQSIFLAGILDEEGRLIETNNTALKVIRANPKDVVGQYFPDTPWWSNREDRDKLVEALRAAQCGFHTGFEATHQKADGGSIRVMFNAMPVFMNKELRIAVTGVDVTQRWQAETALRESERRFRTMADNAPVLIWVAGLDKLCNYFNKVWLDFTGRSLEQEMGDGWAEGVHPDDLPRCFETYASAFDARESFVMEYRLRRHDGEYRWISDRGVPRYDEQGNFFGYIGSCIDITERHEMEETARRLAFYDPLTKLPNRRLLSDRLGQAMAASKRKSVYGALVFLDLDNFKPLNDRHGHAVGDLLLAEVARRIVQCVRETDTVARFGGDEFVVLLGELDADETESLAHTGQVAEKIRMALAEPYVLALPEGGADGQTVTHHCTSSIGVVLFFNQHIGPEELLKRADHAMYQAKADGRNRICYAEGHVASVEETSPADLLAS